jgi:hypothetical protein
VVQSGIFSRLIFWKFLSIITLTKHLPNTHDSAAPPCGGAGAPEVHITSEMVDAGLEVLWASGAVEEQLGSDKLLVSEIFQAMASRAPVASGPDGR